MSILEQMQPIGLDDMNAVRLMNRMDQKYMVSANQLEPLLERIADHYFVQTIPSPSYLSSLTSHHSPYISPYHTLYFDTDGLAMYTMHHNQKLNRQKLRVRTYRSTSTTFFEIKNKDNKKKTHKARIPIDVNMFDQCLSTLEVVDFVDKNTPYPVAALHECLENRFERITLVNKGMSERVTIDCDIRFHNRATGSNADISKLLVIEVKHEVGAPTSAMETALHEMHIQPRRMSKYCIGTVLTDPAAKHNRFKEKILFINKIQTS
ncbi:MAG: polyphosphate polymerase domain-containing protein [bacterium]